MNRRSFIAQALGSSLGASLLAAPALAQTGAPAQNGETPQAAPDYLNARYVRLKGVPPYQIHVVAKEYALYWTLPDNRAVRYPVAIGRPGLYESGFFHVGAKKEWPEWKPTPEMIQREPQVYGKYEDAPMPGGPNNPLGARALYLFTQGGADTMLRIHGTRDLASIGRQASNGCVRMANSHVTHLYDQVPLGVPVYLYPAAA